MIRDFNKVWQNKTGEMVVMMTKVTVEAFTCASEQAATETSKETVSEVDDSQPKVINSLSGTAKQSHVAHAARRLSINEKKRNQEAEFVPVPEGQALFCQIEERTRDLNFSRIKDAPVLSSEVEFLKMNCSAKQT